MTVQNRIFFTYLYLDNTTGMTHLKIQITSNFAVEDVYTELVIDVFYIFNSTVID